MKNYAVPVRTVVNAEYVIEASSKKDANRKVIQAMEESLARLVKQSKPHPQIFGMKAETFTYPSKIKVVW